MKFLSIGYGCDQSSDKALHDTAPGLGIVMLIAFLGLSWYLTRRPARVIEQKKSRWSELDERVERA